MTEDKDAWERGGWMQTFSGTRFHPLDPRPEDIDIIDIAHSLSMQCRYNGHVHKFYSVAEHCIHASNNVSPEHALWALLHDASEAYVGDMIRPLKIHMPAYRDAEQLVMNAIAERFGLPLTIPVEVHQVDTRLLLDERAALMGPPAGDWNVPGEPIGVSIMAWQPQVARAQYLSRFAELTEIAVEDLELELITRSFTVGVSDFGNAVNGSPDQR